MELAGFASRSCSRFAQESHGDGRDAFALAYGADPLRAGGAGGGVDDGVEEDVGVAVAAEAGLAGQRQASQDEGSPFLKAVYIIADADSHVDSLRSGAPLKRRR